MPGINVDRSGSVRVMAEDKMGDGGTGSCADDRRGRFEGRYLEVVGASNGNGEIVMVGRWVSSWGAANGRGG